MVHGGRNRLRRRRAEQKQHLRHDARRNHRAPAAPRRHGPPPTRHRRTHENLALQPIVARERRPAHPRHDWLGTDRTDKPAGHQETREQASCAPPRSACACHDKHRRNAVDALQTPCDTSNGRIPRTSETHRRTATTAPDTVPPREPAAFPTEPTARNGAPPTRSTTHPDLSTSMAYKPPNPAPGKPCIENQPSTSGHIQTESPSGPSTASGTSTTARSVTGSTLPRTCTRPRTNWVISSYNCATTKG